MEVIISEIGQKIKQLIFKNGLDESEIQGLALLQKNGSIVIFKRWMADDASVESAVGKFYYSIDKLGKFQIETSPGALDFIPDIELHVLSEAWNKSIFLFPYFQWKPLPVT